MAPITNCKIDGTCPAGTCPICALLKVQGEAIQFVTSIRVRLRSNTSIPGDALQTHFLVKKTDKRKA